MYPSRSPRRSVTSAGGFTGFVDKILYAATATLALCSLSFATQRMFFDAPPKADEQQVVQSTSATTAGGVARRATRSNEGQERDGSVDPEAPGARDPLRRGPSTAPEPSPAPGVRDGSQPTEAFAAQVGQAADKGSWSLMSAVANVLSFGSGGVSGAPAQATLNTPRASSSAGLPSTGGQVVDVYFGTDEGTVCQPGTREFELTAVPDLYVCVVWKGLSGKYAEQLTFVLPDGNVYQTMTVPFMTIDTPPTVDPMIDIDGRKLEAKRAGWGAKGVTLVTAALPVSGTFITQYRLAGLWTVQVALDGHRVDHNNFELVTP